MSMKSQIKESVEYGIMFHGGGGEAAMECTSVLFQSVGLLLASYIGTAIPYKQKYFNFRVANVYK